MPITTTKGGSADASDITGIEIRRVPTGDLIVNLSWKTGALMKWDYPESFKTKIESAYAEVIEAINTQEGLS